MSQKNQPQTPHRKIYKGGYTLNTMDTTIKLDKKFKAWLKERGKKGETYQDIIKRLIKAIKILKIQKGGRTK